MPDTRPPDAGARPDGAREGSAGAGPRLDAYRPLVEDMRDALRSEYGARTVYPLLARLARDEELRSVLHTLAREEELILDRLRALIAELGAEPAPGDLRRRAMAWALFLATPLIGMRFALRLCHDAESRVGRWYHGYSAWLNDHGDGERALACHELSNLKHTHALVLETFASNAPARRL